MFVNSSLGIHVVWDIYDGDEELLSYVPTIKEILNQIVDELQLSKVGESYKQFEPIGVTGFILLEESHVSIHTWPEHKFAAIDIFSCKPFDENRMKELLEKTFKSTKIIVKKIQRGKEIVPSVF